MSNFDPNRIIWERSRALSHAYWAQYERLIGTFTARTIIQCDDDETQESDYNSIEGLNHGDETNFETEPDIAIDIDCLHDEDESDASEDEESEPELEEEINPEYLEFIKITRQHQKERDRLNQKKKLNLNVEEYYKDISQVNTLVEDNLVRAPDKKDANQLSIARQQEERLIELYGDREAYERIRSMEMSIDEYFNGKFQELAPQYWPVMPLNPKPYLNPIRLEPQ